MSSEGEIPPTVEAVAFAPGRRMGEGLRAAREFLGLTLDDVSEMTKVRAAYLAAVEDMEMERLPSRPFAVGYVRAYAQALGLDETRALARFRAEAPQADERMPNPLGIDNDSDPRRNVLIMVGVVILVAVVIWNIAQRAIKSEATVKKSEVIAVDETPPTVVGAVKLEQLTPPPVEATLPPPYVTPGIEDSDPDYAAVALAEAAQAKLAQATPLGTQLTARGPVRGAPASQSRLVLRAKGSVVVIIRQTGGPVLDTDTLSEGEAYRVSMAPGMVIDVSMPSSVDYYIDNKLAGSLVDAVTPVATLMRGVAPLPVATPLTQGAATASAAVAGAAQRGAAASVARSPTVQPSAPKTIAPPASAAQVPPPTQAPRPSVSRPAP